VVIEESRSDVLLELEVLYFLKASHIKLLLPSLRVSAAADAIAFYKMYRELRSNKKIMKISQISPICVPKKISANPRFH
jgi:hypothetical protein